MHWYVLEENFCQLLMNNIIESYNIDYDNRRIEGLDNMTNPKSVVTIDLDDYGLPIVHSSVK